ncbi:hypothetical protein [Streptomyces qinglanensis]|uniref:hypothetical protein n=1 Tax=Streptomyces qinglanensis TaxID=943816 RepID=UPI003D752ABD
MNRPPRVLVRTAAQQHSSTAAQQHSSTAAPASAAAPQSGKIRSSPAANASRTSSTGTPASRARLPPAASAAARGTPWSVSTSRTWGAMTAGGTEVSAVARACSDWAHEGGGEALLLRELPLPHPGCAAVHAY